MWENNDIWKELNQLWIESWWGEKGRLVKADQYDWEELLDMIWKEDDEFSWIKELKNLEKLKWEK